MHTISVNLEDRTYPIYIQKNLLENIGNEIKKIYKNKKIAIITDSNIDGLYGEIIENKLKKESFAVKKIIIKPGEKSKSFITLEEVVEDMIQFEMNRGDLIIAFGGGVVGDLAGFAASIIMRGIPFVQIPTSLLAQVDSSVGGKTAINSKKGKNLIGSFNQPKAVYIDPELLKTIDRRFLRDGMGEVIKYGAIKDAELFDMLEEMNSIDNIWDIAEDVIYRCCSIKARIVEKDEKDTGDRMLLNFGHTLGHFYEKYYNCERYTHGEAVALGMINITKNSEKEGLTKAGCADRLEKLIGKIGLPVDSDKVTDDEVMEYIRLDKKNIDDGMNVVLLSEIGKSFIRRTGPQELKKIISIE